MKMVIACIALAFVTFGCVADQAPFATQHEGESQSTQAISADGLGTSTAAAALNCSAPVLTCREFCTCQYQECIASGGIPRLCRAEVDGCIRDFCL